jgi:hypothetical protein
MKKFWNILAKFLMILGAIGGVVALLLGGLAVWWMYENRYRQLGRIEYKNFEVNISRRPGPLDIPPCLRVEVENQNNDEVLLLYADAIDTANVFFVDDSIIQVNLLKARFSALNHFEWYTCDSLVVNLNTNNSTFRRDYRGWHITPN